MMSITEALGKIKPLSNSNYPEWAGEMKAWLMRNGYWRLVSGKEVEPKDPVALEKWESKAERAAGEIYLIIEIDKRVHFRGSEEDPVKMWKLLEEAHLSKKPGTRFMPMTICFQSESRMMKLWSIWGLELKRQCRLSKIYIHLNFTLKKLDEELQCMAMIHALPEEYRHLSSSLLLVDKLDKATILQAFRSDELNRQRQGESVIMAKMGKNGKKPWNQKDKAEDKKGGTEDKNKKVSCFLCGKEHWVNKCP